MKKLQAKQESNIVTMGGVTQYQKLMEIAISSNADVDKLEKLMDLQDRWESKEAKKSFTRAMASFQSQCPTIKKVKNGHNYKYAPMCDVIEQVKVLEAECGLSHRFEQDTKGQAIAITCVISHIDGHSERLRLEAEADTSGSKNAVQAIGSTITYLQRYSYLGAFGIATADEDMDGRIPTTEKPASDESLDKIESLIKSTKTDTERFFGFFKVQSVNELNLDQAKQAIQMLEAKK